MPYDPPTIYEPYLPAADEEGSGCADCKDCECCPPGLISLRDSAGNHLGCLTPNDADLYNQTNINCQSGYIKLYKNDATPVFYGCVSETEYAALYAVINPSA